MGSWPACFPCRYWSDTAASSPADVIRGHRPPRLNITAFPDRGLRRGRPGFRLCLLRRLRAGRIFPDRRCGAHGLGWAQSRLPADVVRRLNRSSKSRSCSSPQAWPPWRRPPPPKSRRSRNRCGLSMELLRSWKTIKRLWRFPRTRSSFPMTPRRPASEWRPRRFSCPMPNMLSCGTSRIRTRESMRLHRRWAMRSPGRPTKRRLRPAIFCRSRATWRSTSIVTSRWPCRCS